MNEEYKGSVLSGEVFNQLFTGNFIVLTDDELKVDYYKLTVDGLNECVLNVQTNGYATGGLPFYDMWTILDHIKPANMPTFYRNVELVLDDAQIHIDDKSYNTDKYILSDPILLENLPVWKDIPFCKKSIAEDYKYIQFIKDTPEHIYVTMVTKYPTLIKLVYKLTKNICLAAVSVKGAVLKDIDEKDQDLDICRAAVLQNPQAVKYAKFQDESMCIDGLNINGLLLAYVKDKTPDLCTIAVHTTPSAIQFVPDDLHTEEMCEYAVSKNFNLLKYTNCLSRQFILNLLTQNGIYLEHIKDQDLEMCLTAVRSDFNAIKYAKFQTEDMCEYAVANDGDLLAHVQEQTYLICKTALNQNIDSFRFVSVADKYLIQMAVANNGLHLEHISEEDRTADIITAAVDNNWEALKFVDKTNQTEDICNLAFYQNDKALKYMHYQTLNQVLSAVTVDGLLLEYVLPDLINQEVCDAATEVNINAIKFVPPKFQSEPLCLKVVNHTAVLIQYVEEPTENVCLAAVMRSSDAYEHIKKPTENAIIALVSENGANLKLVKEEHQTAEICLTAVKQSSTAIQWAHIQNEEICLAACASASYLMQHIKVRTPKVLIKMCTLNGYVLKDIPAYEQTDDICLAAVKDWGSALQYVTNPTYKICLEAVKKTALSVEYVPIRFQTDEICTIAVSDSPYTIKYIKNPSDKIIKEALKSNSYAMSYLTDKDKTLENKLHAMYYHPTAVSVLNDESAEFYLHAFMCNPELENHSDRLSKSVLDEISQHPYLKFIHHEIGDLSDLTAKPATNYYNTNTNKIPETDPYDFDKYNIFDDVDTDNKSDDEYDNYRYNTNDWFKNSSKRKSLKPYNEDEFSYMS